MEIVVSKKYKLNVVFILVQQVENSPVADDLCCGVGAKPGAPLEGYLTTHFNSCRNYRTFKLL